MILSSVIWGSVLFGFDIQSPMRRTFSISFLKPFLEKRDRNTKMIYMKHKKCVKFTTTRETKISITNTMLILIITIISVG